MAPGARTALIILLVLMLGTAMLQAQTDYRVIEVEVEGNKRASRSLILGVASITAGSPLTPSSIGETITRLYGLGIFSDVRIEAEEVPGGLKIFIVVEELPKLIGLEFSGNNKVKSDDLKKDLKLGVGGYISAYLINSKAQEIKDIYGDKGYFRAEVDHTLEYNADSSEAVLTYQVIEHSKVKVENVVMPEALAVLSEDLRTELQQAVEAVDFNKALSLIEQIRQHNESLADALVDLVKHYRFDTLQDLFEELE